MATLLAFDTQAMWWGGCWSRDKVRIGDVIDWQVTRWQLALDRWLLTYDRKTVCRVTLWQFVMWQNESLSCDRMTVCHVTLWKVAMWQDDNWSRHRVTVCHVTGWQLVMWQADVLYFMELILQSAVTSITYYFIQPLVQPISCYFNETMFQSVATPDSWLKPVATSISVYSITWLLFHCILISAGCYRLI